MTSSVSTRDLASALACTYKVMLENFKAELPIPQDGAPEPKQPTATITVK